MFEECFDLENIQDRTAVFRIVSCLLQFLLTSKRFRAFTHEVRVSYLSKYTAIFVILFSLFRLPTVTDFAFYDGTFGIVTMNLLTTTVTLNSLLFWIWNDKNQGCKQGRGSLSIQNTLTILWCCFDWSAYRNYPISDYGSPFGFILSQEALALSYRELFPHGVALHLHLMGSSSPPVPITGPGMVQQSGRACLDFSDRRSHSDHVVSIW